MNEQLIKFIEICLVDGVISDKEKEVIFRKSKDLGVPKDECEIILEGMISQHKEKFSEKKTETLKNNVDLKESYVDLNLPEEWLDNLKQLNQATKDVINKENITKFIESGEFKKTLNHSRYIHTNEILNTMINQPLNGLDRGWFTNTPNPNKGNGTLERELKYKLESILKEEQFWGYCVRWRNFYGENVNDHDARFLRNRKQIEDEIEKQKLYLEKDNYENWGYWYNNSSGDGFWCFAIFTNLGIHVFHRGNTERSYDNYYGYEQFSGFHSYNDLIEGIPDPDPDGYATIYRMVENKNPMPYGENSMVAHCRKYLFARDINIDFKSLLLNLKLSYNDQLFIETVKSFKFKDKDLDSLMRVNHYITKSINNYNDKLDQLNISDIYDVKSLINDNTTDYHWENLQSIKRISSYYQKFILYVTNILMMRDIMLNFLMSSDPVSAEKILLQLEEIGVLETTFERNLLGSLNNITSQLSYLNETILSISNDLVYHLRSIDNKIGQQNNNLSEISRKLTYNNLISTISAYQLWKVNKNTKGLN